MVIYGFNQPPLSRKPLSKTEVVLAWISGAAWLVFAISLFT